MSAQPDRARVLRPVLPIARGYDSRRLTGTGVTADDADDADDAAFTERVRAATFSRGGEPWVP